MENEKRSCEPSAIDKDKENKPNMAQVAGNTGANANLNIEHANLDPSQLTYNDQGLIPCIVQDKLTGDVLMMAWMNEDSVSFTIQQKTTWFYSRSRACLWHKGESSGNTQKLVSLRYDCDADCLLAGVIPAGPACHTGNKSCFYRQFDLNAPNKAPSK